MSRQLVQLYWEDFEGEGGQHWLWTPEGWDQERVMQEILAMVMAHGQRHAEDLEWRDLGWVELGPEMEWLKPEVQIPIPEPHIKLYEHAELCPHGVDPYVEYCDRCED